MALQPYFLRHSNGAILDVSTPVATPQTGAAYQVVFRDPSLQRPVLAPANGTVLSNYTFYLWLVVTQAGGASSPTTDVKVQVSHDGTNWQDLGAPLQLTTDETVVALLPLSVLPPYFRVLTELGGGTPPNHTVRAVPVANVPFLLRT